MKSLHRKNGFGLLELLLAVGILAILIIIGAGVQQQTVALGKNAKCIRNLRQVSALIHAYLADHRQTYPLSAYREGDSGPYSFWVQDVVAHSGDPATLASFICPGVSDIPDDLRKLRGGHAYVSYGINRYGVSPASSEVPWLHPAVQTRIEEPSRLMLLLEFEANSQPWDGWYSADSTSLDRNWKLISGRHRTVNALYCDGHVAPVTRDELLSPPVSEFPWGTYRYTLYQ